MERSNLFSVLKVVNPECSGGLIICDVVKFGVARASSLFLVFELVLILLDVLQNLLCFPAFLRVHYHGVLYDDSEEGIKFHERGLIILEVYDIVHFIGVVPLEQWLQSHHFVEDNTVVVDP